MNWEELDQRDSSKENPNYRKEKKVTREAEKKRADIPPSFWLPEFRKTPQR